MGLDIRCVGSPCQSYHSSYSGVHLSRKDWIIATYLYIINNIISNCDIDILNSKYKKINEFNKKFVENGFNYDTKNYDETLKNLYEYADEFYCDEYAYNDDEYDDDDENINNIKNKFNKFNNYQKLVSILKNMINLDKDDIDYNYIIRQRAKIKTELSKAGLLGLMHWVDHSDCDGYLSPGQSYDIFNLLEKIGRYLCYIRFNKKYNSEKLNDEKYNFVSYMSKEDLELYLKKMITCDYLHELPKIFKDMEDDGIDGKFHYNTQELENAELMYNIVKYSFTYNKKVIFS